MTAHILFGASNQSTSLDLWATQAGSTSGSTFGSTSGPTSGAVDLGVAITQDFDPVRIGAITLFIGGNAQGVQQLWKTDGTVAGTIAFPLRDASGQLLTVNAMQAFGGRAVIAAENPVTHAGSVWITNGTGAGTTLLATGLTASGFQVVGDTLYFTGAPDPFNAGNEQLFSSNGTEAGTVRISPLGTTMAPDAFAALGGGTLLFENDRDANGNPASTLWVTNGTISGTHQLTPDNLGTDVGANDFVSLGTVALFSFAVGDAGGSALWISDGTAAGTRQIVVAKSVVLSDVGDLTLFGGKVLFAATDSDGNSGLWITDGTDAGTRLLRQYADIGSLTAFGSRLAFTALDANNHPSLWVTDGTTAGTVEILPANTASTGLDPQGLFAYFDRIGFTGTNAKGQQGLWLSDGTSTGTAAIAVPGVATMTTETTALAGSGNVILLDQVGSPYVAVDGDTIRAGTGNGVVIDPIGAVLVTGGPGSLLFEGGTGASTVTGGTGPLTVSGGSGGGVYTGGSAGGNLLVAGGGNTTLVGGGAHDALFGAASGQTAMVAVGAHATLVGGGGVTGLWGGASGGAVMFTGNGSSTVYGSTSGQDTIVGGSGALQVNASGGEAVFSGSNSTVVTGSRTAADSIIGGAGSLVVSGQGGNMLVVGGSGAAAITVGTGYGLVFQGSGAMSIAGDGPLQIIEGSGSATIAAGAGGIVLDIVKGAAGGLDVVSGFRPASDQIDLFGFTKADLHTHVQNGSVTITMADGSRITLAGVSDPGQSVHFA